jgi:hypothetical protein
MNKMGSCCTKHTPPIEWKINPINFIDNLDDICCVCHEDFIGKLCISQCCNHFFHHGCIVKYHSYCKLTGKIVKCPICREVTKSIV